MNIVMIGKPGSGKGTVSAYLQKDFQLPYLSPGDIYRQEIENGTEIGKLAQSLIDQGNFMPDNVTLQLVKERLVGMKKGFIMDGFPRNLVQAEAFDAMLKEMNLSLDVALYFDVRDETVIDRLSKRLVCPKCQSSYHLTTRPPHISNVCDHCQESLVMRKDDTPELIQHRLNVYDKNTKPLLPYYEEQNILRTIQSDSDIQNVEHQIRTLVLGI